MTRTEFSAWCKTVHLLDGATGSMLRAAGMPAGVCSETWVLAHPQALLDLQRAYLAAGSEIIYAPTFGANRVLLGHHDLQREVRALNRDLVQLGREAVGTSALLAGDMTTTGRPVTPGDDSAYETLLEIYREQAEALLLAGICLPDTVQRIAVLLIVGLHIAGGFKILLCVIEIAFFCIYAAFQEIPFRLPVRKRKNV